MKRFFKLIKLRGNIKLIYLTTIFLTTLLITPITINYYVNNQKISKPTINNGTNKISKEKELWSQKIDKLGAEVTYQEFKQSNSKLNREYQHSMTHMFGGLLYEKQGKTGLIACDSAFGFGCYHGFFVAFLSTEGIGRIKELDKVCVSDKSAGNQNCQHGLGHGLMEYFGPGKLLDALYTCRQTTKVDNVHGCTAGVFMDYNVPLSVNGSSPQVRKLTGDPYEPCPSVPDEFKDSCYYQITQWWAQVFNNDFRKIGELCFQIKDDENRKSCFLGIGISATDNNLYDPIKIVNSCNSLPNLETQVICKKEAYNNFYTQEAFKDKAWILCDGLGSEQKKKCMGFRN